MKNAWSVYMVRCRDGTIYTGITNNLEQRIVEHNRGRGGRYTSGRSPVRLLYVEEVPDRSSALRREACIKSLSRRGKLLLIRSGCEG